MDHLDITLVVLVKVHCQQRKRKLSAHSFVQDLSHRPWCRKWLSVSPMMSKSFEKTNGLLHGASAPQAMNSRNYELFILGSGAAWARLRMGGKDWTLWPFPLFVPDRPQGTRVCPWQASWSVWTSHDRCWSCDVSRLPWQTRHTDGETMELLMCRLLRPVLSFH